MEAQETGQLRGDELDDGLDALPADPDAKEFAERGGGYAALMSPPDRWLSIPAG
jgi:hypothetical protein